MANIQYLEKWCNRTVCTLYCVQHWTPTCLPVFVFTFMCMLYLLFSNQPSTSNLKCFFSAFFLSEMFSFFYSFFFLSKEEHCLSKRSFRNEGNNNKMSEREASIWCERQIFFFGFGFWYWSKMRRHWCAMVSSVGVFLFDDNALMLIWNGSNYGRRDHACFSIIILLEYYFIALRNVVFQSNALDLEFKTLWLYGSESLFR